MSALRFERNSYVGPSKDKQPLLIRFLGLSHVAKMSLKILIVVIYNTRNWKESQSPSKMYKCLLKKHAVIQRKEQFRSFTQNNSRDGLWKWKREEAKECL